MEEEELMEFTVAHRRKYNIEHIWFQEKEEVLTVGISDFLAQDIGDVLRVILPQAEDELDKGDEMFSLWTAEGKQTFRSPFAGTITEVNGEVEINPDLVNESPYDLGWMIIVQPHEFDVEDLLDPDEYVETLAEA
jgi:glycine cleavage system H protein